MIRPEHPYRLLAAAGLAALIGCQSAAPRTDSMTLEVGAPADVEGVYDTVLSYLLERYDADADGRISAAEYDRTGGQFDRLDNNGDGFVDEQDYAASEGGDDMRASMGARMVIYSHFESDDSNEGLARAELLDSFARFDADGDGQLIQSEFAKALEGAPSESAGTEEASMMKRMLGDTDPFELLLNGVDKDSSGSISAAELGAFFDDADDGDGVWTRGGSGRRGAGAQGAPREMRGAQVGTIAPDFTLASPHGGDPVALSSFAGNKPVALIFGSYT